MGLLSIFKRQPGAAAPVAGANAAQGVADAGTRAKRRLLGAVVLLGIGVIAFPLLFETQPRPIPVDIAIEIPRKESALPLAMPAARPAVPAAAAVPAPATSAVAEAKPEAAKEVAAPPPPETKLEPAPAPKAAELPPKPAAAPKVEAKRSAANEAKPPSSTEVPGRYVVQIGAYANADVARETRAKLERLGLRTYTQTADTDAGKRIRVRLGPFATRDEADKAAAKVKAAGMPAAVLTL